jgi:hypothetical protein
MPKISVAKVSQIMPKMKPAITASNLPFVIPKKTILIKTMFGKAPKILKLRLKKNWLRIIKITNNKEAKIFFN